MRGLEESLCGDLMQLYAAQYVYTISTNHAQFEHRASELWGLSELMQFTLTEIARQNWANQKE